MAIDILAVGDPTIDTFLQIHEAHIALQLDPADTQLCIDYADKIPVDAYERLVAGGCFNVAVSTARLGLRTAVFGYAGADPEGESIRAALLREGIDPSFLETDPSHGTNASTAVVFRGERTIFVWHQPREYRLPSLPPLRWLYFTSVGPPGPAVERLHADACAAIDRGGAQLAFAPGTHQLRMGARALDGLLRRARLLLLNRDEASLLTGLRDAPPSRLLAALRALGPAQVVVTDGHAGSYGWDGSQELWSPILEAPIVDRTGAGDAFGSAVVAALDGGRPLAEAMAWGTVQAAHCVGAFGATPGLAVRAVVEAEVAAHPGLRGRAPVPA